jgi:hypothetical protein
VPRNPRTNEALSAKRAQACRSYLISSGIDASRITAVGHGAERPAAPTRDLTGGRADRTRTGLLALGGGKPGPAVGLIRGARYFV